MREEENKRSSKNEENSFDLQSFLKKRWVVPAVYLVAAAGVLSAVFFMQGGDESALPGEGVEVEDPSQEGMYGEEAVEVTAANEVIKKPVAEEEGIEVVVHYFDESASAEEKELALVYYNNEYRQNKGIDFGHVENESFDVAAALSGTVVKSEKDALLGYVVEVSHDNGIVTHYHSLDGVELEEGQVVRQGDVIGQAARNLYNQEAGVHVHFAIRQDGVAVNPSDVFEQPIDSIGDAVKKQQETANAEEEAPAEGTEPAEGEKEDKPADENADALGDEDETEAPAEDEDGAEESDEEENNIG
ncbi:M23 family metallopeptidase [Alkalihalophilus marmarensis]|uniref:Stage II sporulation protein n=1 Tax=Alkalihalophilus marmarensis DSM 21297 TaxID=1188261 RepID=U6SKL5_9BACI|nr:M23 family metallopeptidase [Alkalihalophilus marmarensis]ERN51907.1 stage II sporulation protein [Alkalihalophilus marmarensis DSM 21297]